MKQRSSSLSIQGTTEELWQNSVALARGRQTEQEYVSSLLTMDAERLHPQGLTLSVSHTGDGWLSVLMKHHSSGKLCAAFEFLPHRAQFRRSGELTHYSPAHLPEDCIHGMPC